MNFHKKLFFTIFILNLVFIHELFSKNNSLGILKDVLKNINIIKSDYLTGSNLIGANTSTSKNKQLQLAPPNISGFSPLAGPIGTLITITGDNFNLPLAIKIGGVEALIISNTNVEVVIMVMPNSATDKISITTQSGIVYSDSPFTISSSQVPFRQQGSKLISTDGIGTPFFGTAIALSADGNTALIGGPFDNTYQGAAWIFTRSEAKWNQQVKLIGNDSAGFPIKGISVALSADGNTALVGGYMDNTNQGATWVFTRNSGVWNQQGNKLVGTGNIGMAGQGYSVALSADGNTALVGAFADNGNHGAAWVFTRSAGVWSQQGSKLIGTGNIGKAEQGKAVALSADGNTAVVSGWVDNLQRGAVWVFTRNEGVWTQQGGKIVGTGIDYGSFHGVSIDLNADGNVMIVGGYLDNSHTGAVWIYTRSEGIWSQQGNKLIGTGNIGKAYQGTSVAINAAGNIIAFGGQNDNSGQGAIWVFTNNGGVWSQLNSKLVGSNNIGVAEQGRSIAMSADGNTIIEGGGFDNSQYGAAWVYSSCNDELTLSSPADDYFGGTIQKIISNGVGKINASNKISDNSDVLFYSHIIELKPGFVVNNGTVFRAEIGGCN